MSFPNVTGSRAYKTPASSICQSRVCGDVLRFQPYLWVWAACWHLCVPHASRVRATPAVGMRNWGAALPSRLDLPWGFCGRPGFILYTLVRPRPHCSRWADRAVLSESVRPQAQRHMCVSGWGHSGVAGTSSVCLPQASAASRASVAPALSQLIA